MAASPLLDDEATYSLFSTQASRVAEAFGTYIVVSSLDPPHQVLNTRFQAGATLPPMVAPGAVGAMLRSGRAAVSDLRVPPAVGGPVVAGMAPVLRYGAEPRLAVVLPFRPSRLVQILQAQGLSGGAFATLVDGNGAVVARSAEQERFVGRRVPDWYAARTEGREAGLLEGAAMDGELMIYGFQRLRNASGWTVLVAEPAASYRRAWLVPLLGLVGGAAAAFMLGIALAVLVTRRILRPLSALAVWRDKLGASSATIRMRVWCRGDWMIVATRHGGKRFSDDARQSG